MKTKQLILICVFAVFANRVMAGDPVKMYGIDGIDLGIKYAHLTEFPRDPKTRMFISTITGDLRSPNEAALVGSFYHLDFQCYGSLIGSLLLQKESRFVLGDMSEVGVSFGYMHARNINSDLNKSTDNTAGAQVNLGTGIIAGYRLNEAMFISVRYQWIIDQAFAFYVLSGKNDVAMHRKRLSGTFTYNDLFISVNVGRPWKLYDDKTEGIKFANTAWGFALKKNVGENKHIGFSFDAVKMRYDYGSTAFRYWEKNWWQCAFSFGVGI